MSRPKKLILVIEADEVLLSGLLFSLLVHGYRVIGVRDVVQAQEAVRNHPIDAIYMRTRIANDFSLPVVVSASMQEALVKLQIAVLKHRYFGQKIEAKSSENTRGKTQPDQGLPTPSSRATQEG